MPLPPQDLPAIRHAAKVAAELWSGDLADRPAVIAAWTDVYGTSPKPLGVLHNALARRRRQDLADRGEAPPLSNYRPSNA